MSEWWWWWWWWWIWPTEREIVRLAPPSFPPVRFAVVRPMLILLLLLILLILLILLLRELQLAFGLVVRFPPPLARCALVRAFGVWLCRKVGRRVRKEARANGLYRQAWGKRGRNDALPNYLVGSVWDGDLKMASGRDARPADQRSEVLAKWPQAMVESGISFAQSAEP